jgi:[ribosomal protein S5]-alanine N-acetyltransferase
LERTVYKGVPTLETERLILRAISVDDIQSMYNHMKDMEVRKFFEKFWPKDIEGVEKFVRAAVQKNEDDQSAEWVILLKDEKRFVGRIRLSEHLYWCNSAMIGYSFDKDYWGQGLASEAINRVIQFGFDEMHLNRIEAWHDSLNAASGKVILKCGLTFEGTLRERGQSGNAEMYSILQYEYQEKNRK